MQAKAVVALAPRQIVVQEVTVPDPGPEDVVVRVTCSWISNGTEGSYVRGERIGGDTPRLAADPMPFPHIPGYQKVGIVEAVGRDVSHVVPGDRVFATISKIEGMFFPYAGHVSPTVTHRSQVWKLPPTPEPETFSGMVLTQVGYNIGIGFECKAGDAAVVIGDGMVGHWAAQTLQHRGMRVLLLGKHEDRLSRFTCHAGDKTVNITDGDVLSAVKSWADTGVSFIADTVGSIATMESLYPVIHRGGNLSSAGFYGTNGLLDIQKMRDRELTLRAPSGWTGERMDRTFELLSSGALTTLHLVTHRFPVDEAADAFSLILSRQEPVLGVLLLWE